jgi:hypothetical protein
MTSPFKQIDLPFKSGDIAFFFTDGVEEAQRFLRDSSFQGYSLTEEDIKSGKVAATFKPTESVEPMGVERVQAILDSVMKKRTYKLEKMLNPLGDEELIFDFSSCTGRVQDAIMALVAVEKIFRMNPDPSAGANDRVHIDRKVDAFLKEHFIQYGRYFHHPLDISDLPNFESYAYYSHIKEDDQYDDLTLMGIRKK